jgi:hypothetical protein
MAFAQFTYRESLRDIQPCLLPTHSKLYHLGIQGKVSRNSLSHANQIRDWRIYADFAKGLIGQARKLYAADSFGSELKQTVYTLDSTTIDLCLSLFPWTKFRKRKGAVKMHTLLDLHGLFHYVFKMALIQGQLVSCRVENLFAAISAKPNSA